MRRLALALLLCLCPVIAEAADGAQFQALGFSPDARYFAFEQFGIQDGSGFSYADVFIIDTEKNEWVKGSPIREMTEDESGKLGLSHARALERAAPLLKSAGITEPAELLAAFPATQVGLPRNMVKFDRYYNSTGGGAEDGTANAEIRMELALSTAEVAIPENCKAYEEPVKGFTLTMKRGEQAQPATVHSDAALPASRGCALGYDIAAVYGPSGYPETRRLVALIAVYTRGFEGQDRRYIAVPFADP
ncbi:DUF2259 domain-containing protein [Aestuariivirga sp.]|uniref:DUF2259 domain-containing protein n=1 Tax=Aestuariivirga sp. TaxID=2650926 RepID=UPI0039E61355